MKFTSDWVSYNTEKWMAILNKLRGGEAHALEIGSYEGRSTFWFLQHVLTHPDSTITCVDPWGDERTRQRFLENLAECPSGHKVRQVVSRSDETRLDERKWDFVYVDGWHSAAAVMLDSARAWPALKEGGFMIWDDYEWKKHKDPRLNPKLGIDSFLAAMSPHLKVLFKGYQVAVVKSTDPNA